MEIIVVNAQPAATVRWEMIRGGMVPLRTLSVGSRRKVRQAGSALPFASPELKADEDGGYQTEAKEATPDPRVAPRVGRATPLQRKQQADDAAYQEKSTQEIHLAYLLLEGEFTRLALGILEEHKDRRQRHATEATFLVSKVDPN